jgi:hypothetical protein
MLKRGWTIEKDSELFVGLDTSKLKISVADGGRDGDVRFFGDISAEPASVASMVAKLAKRGGKLHFCYEAGPTDTSFTARSLGWATVVRWWPHRSYPGARVTGSRPTDATLSAWPGSTGLAS